MSTRIDRPRGHAVAWTGFVFGSLTSVATNVLHTFLPTVHMPSGLALTIAARVGSAVWPIGLLLSVEVLSRVAWRRGPFWSVARFGGAGTVALGSAVISYSHVRDVLLAWGYGHPAAEFGPLTLDGLMVVCGFALLSMTPPAAVSPREQAEPNSVGTSPVPARALKVPATREIPLAAQIEALPDPVRPLAEAVATVSGQTDATVDGAVTGEDIEADSRRLRARELQAQGWTHARIATELAVSKRTVRRYLSASADTEPATSDHTVSAEATPVSTPDGADTTPSPSAVGWLTEIDTNHHDNHQGVPA
ncbi:terminase gpP N-terminus-related DNA-binding protein [Nocardia sp. NBC_00511]|uniref:terminase gpP N-terminus-related DNA-binding protein n=1 Tax=Nocardia sp. NBC_00511 TaxID=2903591 RepID=UPI0030E1EF5C